MSEKTQKTISERLTDIMSEVRSIGKDSINRQQGFNFRGIDAVMNHLHPIFAKHGVIITSKILSDRSEERATKSGGNLIYRILTIQYSFVGADGSERQTEVIGEGMDSGDKAANKAMAVGLKYALTQTLLLPYDEIDPDGETHQVSTPKSKPKPEPAPAQKAHTQTPDSEIWNGEGLVLGEVKRKTGTGKKGDWTRYYSKGDDGEFYSTFDHEIGRQMTEHALIGNPVRLKYRLEETPKGTSRTVLEINEDTPDAEPDADSQRKGQKEPDGNTDQDDINF
ncbi:MAG: ERF family protein [Eubacteriales bacterium]|jgi:hypothetical protein